MSTETMLAYLADNWIVVAVIFGLIVLSGFFSGTETALTAVSRARAHA